MPTLRDRAKDRIDAILTRYPSKHSAVLPLCQLAQKEFGYLSTAAMQEVADILDVDPTLVKGLVGFYSLLHDKPTGKYVIEICNDLPCALRGADQLVDHVCRELDVCPGGTTDDGLFTVETVMCIAACDRAPAAQINLEYYENLDPERFSKIFDRLRSEGEQTVEGSGAGTVSRD